MERHDLNERKVVITADDIKNIAEFFSHFKIKMSVGLIKSIEDFNSNPTGFTFDDQIKLRAYLAHSIVISDHPLITDKVFNNIRTNCDRVWFDTQFDLDSQELFEGKEITEKG